MRSYRRVLPVLLIAGFAAAPNGATATAAPEAFAAAPGGGARATPCIPLRARLTIDDRRLWHFAPWFDDDGRLRGPRGRYGTCSVRDGVVRTADGTRVLDLSCGVNVHVPGVVDDHGIEVGTRGEDVLRRHGEGTAARLVCQPFRSGPDRVMCWMPPPRRDEGYTPYKWAYIVAGAAPDRCPDLTDPAQRTDAHCDDPLTRDAALDFFAPRRVVEMVYRGNCH